MEVGFYFLARTIYLAIARDLGTANTIIILHPVLAVLPYDLIILLECRLYVIVDVFEEYGGFLRDYASKVQRIRLWDTAHGP
jgi:hypothetical protein